MAEWFDQDTQQWYSTETEQWNPIEVDPHILPPDEYVPPGWGSIGFEFTTDGYTAPPWSEIPFEWYGAITQVFNLGASVTVDPTRTDAPYCEIKRSNQIALGFGDSGWQILKGITEYSCVYDLNAILNAIPPHADLGAYIFAFTTFTGEKDLAALLSGWAERDLGGIVYGIPPRDIGAYIKSTIQEYADLGGYIRAWHPRDLGGVIGATHERDLPAILVTIQPKDLPAYLKAYPQEDLPAVIVGWAERDLGAFIKIDVREFANLGALIGVYVPRDLGATIKGWCYESPFDLGAFINPLDIADLPAFLFARPFGQLGAIIYGIPPRDLPAFIHGWQELDLGGIISGITDRQKDLIALIAGVGGADLPGIIHGWQAVNLAATIFGQNALDLQAIITALGSVKDLPAYIFAGGFANLGAIITPRLIKLAVLMPVHTMEYLDLSAVISLQPCYNQGIADLGARMIIFQKHDLIATIYGLGALGANIRDLAAVIAVGDYIYDKDAVDDLSITFTTYAEALALDDLPITWFDMMVSSTDELGICFVPGGGCKIPANLLTAIIGHNPNFDLAAYINGVVQAPYIFGDPIFGPWDVDTLFTAPYVYNNRVLWERLVQISFFSQVYDYFYQSVSTSLWKDDDAEKWTLNVASWLEEETYLRDRTSLREKLINEIEEFESVDEAIRYAIDWVISFPTKDLGAQIHGTTWWDEALNPTMKDLEAQIRSFGSITYSSSFDLRAMTTPFHPRDLGAVIENIYGNGSPWAGHEYRDLPGRVGYWWETNLGATVQIINWHNAHIEMEAGGYEAPPFEDVDVEI